MKKWVLAIALLLALAWAANRVLEIIDIKVCSRVSPEAFKDLKCEEVIDGRN